MTVASNELACAVDLGGTKIEACLVDARGTVVAGSRRRAETGSQQDARGLREAVHDVVAHAIRSVPADATLVGVGIGSAGPVDVVAGTVSPLNLPRAAGFPVVDAARTALAPSSRALPIRLALDGQCIALAEHWVGAGQDVESMLGMVVSTGIGGGIVARGVPFAGSSGNAGHIGQIEVAGFLPEGVHGLDSTVERIASGPNIVRWAQAQGWPGSTGEDLARDYARGDAIAVSAVQRSAAAVGAAIASASALLDIDLVVIGGGFAQVSTDYVGLVTAARDRFAAHPFMARAAIVPAALGADSPLIGAAALVLTTLYATDRPAQS